MNNKNVVLIFVLCLIPFIIYGFSDRLIEADSYYYFNSICHNTSLVNDSSFAWEYLLFLFPCDFLAIKAYLFLLFFLSAIVFSKIGELFDKNIGWFAGLIFISFTWIITEYWKFENDTLGYFFAFIGIYFALRCALIGKWFSFSSLKRIDFLLALGFIFISGLFWQGSIYWLIGFGLLSVIFVPISVVVIIVFYNYLPYFLFPNRLVFENQPFIGLIWLGITTFFLFGIIKTNKKVVLSYLVFIVVALLMAKLFVLVVPFAVIIVLNAIKVLRINKKVFGTALITFTLLCSIFFGLMTYAQYPTQEDIRIIKKAIEYDNKTQNTFGAGYIIEYYGGTPSSKGWPTNQDYNETGLVITSTDKNSWACETIQKTRYLALLNCGKE